MLYLCLGIAGLALLFSVYSIFAVRKATSWKSFFNKTDLEPENLEDMIEQIVAKIKELDADTIKAFQMLEATTAQLQLATQNVGLVRYNSNGDDGGNLSFSTALLDANQSGILITSLHGRQHNRIYAKIISNGTSESTLSEEEKEALVQAISRNK